MSNRKQYSPKQKVSIVRRHLLENVPVSDLCDEFGIHATQYYHWQKQLFENGEGAFARRPNKANAKRQQNAHEKKIGQLEEKLQNRNEVVAELLLRRVTQARRGECCVVNVTCSFPWSTEIALSRE